MFSSLTFFDAILSNKNIPTTTVICIQLWWIQRATAGDREPV